jgi:hypothetical protein
MLERFIPLDHLDSSIGSSVFLCLVDRRDGASGIDGDRKNQRFHFGPVNLSTFVDSMPKVARAVAFKHQKV